MSDKDLKGLLIMHGTGINPLTIKSYTDGLEALNLIENISTDKKFRLWRIKPECIAKILHRPIKTFKDEPKHTKETN